MKVGNPMSLRDGCRFPLKRLTAAAAGASPKSEAVLRSRRGASGGVRGFEADHADEVAAGKGIGAAQDFGLHFAHGFGGAVLSDFGGGDPALICSRQPRFDAIHPVLYCTDFFGQRVEPVHQDIVIHTCILP